MTRPIISSALILFLPLFIAFPLFSYAMPGYPSDSLNIFSAEPEPEYHFSPAAIATFNTTMELHKGNFGGFNVQFLVLF